MTDHAVSPRSRDSFPLIKFVPRHIKRLIGSLIVMLACLFSASAYAVTNVGLAILNDTDSNGNFTVIEGDKVRVAYSVIEDSNNDLGRKDRIELVRLSDDKVIASVARGKKKDGTVSLKVRNSVDEQLYVRYRTGGSSIIVVSRAAHPDDDFYRPLRSIAKASANDLALELNAMKTGRAVSVHAAAFKNVVFGSTGCNYNLSNAFYGYFSSGSDCNAITGVSLPDRVELSSLNCRVYDSSFTGGWEITSASLRRVELTGIVSNDEDVFVAGPSDSTAGFQILTDTTPEAGTSIVDNSEYAYLIHIDFGAGVAASTAIRLYGCWISY